MSTIQFSVSASTHLSPRGQSCPNQRFSVVKERRPGYNKAAECTACHMELVAYEGQGITAELRLE